MTDLQIRRREEIMDACEELFAHEEYADINLKEISKITSFSRPTIYNYFTTKEEIFLALLTREYEHWIETIKKLMRDTATLSADEFAEKIADSFAAQPLMLRIISLNLQDLETRTRYEHVVIFKKAYGAMLRVMQEALDQYFPGFTTDKKEAILYAFFPFLYGVYPYTVVTEVQRQAMQEAGIDYKYKSEKQLIQACLLQLLK